MESWQNKFDRDNFSGDTRLFPLPGFVLFPGVIQPLHIFEPRYIQMTEAAIESDGLITMCALDQNQLNPDPIKPPLHSYGCLGKIVLTEQLDDGRYNLMLFGMYRVKIEEEYPSNHLFREAKVSLLDDYYPDQDPSVRERMVQQLIHLSTEVLSLKSGEEESIKKLCQENQFLGKLADLIAHLANLELVHKLSLLEQLDVDQRAKWLIRHLNQFVESDYLPKFSDN
jgi:Lon protease-like protein